MARRRGGILGLETGIVQAPMGPDISGPDLVAAVANAGGLGILSAPSQVRGWVGVCVPHGLP
jgi:NAD(P)H-dependent flavin oxidoreductase YrpB (nitropropane dioxygenase family)